MKTITPAADVRRHILETGQAIMGGKGFSAVGLTEILNAAGVPKGSFYYYFKSKDDLLDKFYKIPCGLSMEEFGTIFSMDSYVEQLWMINKKQIDFVQEKGLEIVKQIMIKNLSDDQGTFAIDTSEIKDMIKLMVSIIDKGKQSGQIKSQIDSKDLVRMFHQFFHSTMFVWATRNGDFDFENYLRYHFEVLYQVEDSQRKARTLGIEEL